MSMNLHCEQVELWQTPTYITYMCYSNRDGGWKGILYRYSEWVKSFLNGCWKSNEDFEEMKDRIDKHLAALNSYKKLTFFII